MDPDVPSPVTSGGSFHCPCEAFHFPVIWREAELRQAQGVPPSVVTAASGHAMEDLEMIISVEIFPWSVALGGRGQLMPCL